MAKTYIPVFHYRDKAANAVSVSGSAAVVAGGACLAIASRFGDLLSGKTADGLTIAAFIGVFAGIAAMGAAWLLNRKRTLAAIRKAVREKGLESAMSGNVQQALTVYRMMPSRQMERWIASLNPEAGAYIAAHRRTLKRSR